MDVDDSHAIYRTERVAMPAKNPASEEAGYNKFLPLLVLL
jgi:hypothetical protein